MDNSFKNLIEKLQPINVAIPLSERSPKEYAQFINDMDKTWMSDQEAIGGYQLMEHLQELPEEDAALLLTSLLEPHLDLGLNERLNAVGIMVGELTPGPSTPSGVRSILRLGTPMILITEFESSAYHRPSEIARAIGEMVCGHSDSEAIVKFLRAFDANMALVDATYFKEIE